MSVCKMWSPGGSPWAAPNGAPMYVKDPCWVWKRVHLGPWLAQSILVWNKPLESGDPSLFGQHIGAPVPHFEHSHRGPSAHRVLAWAWWFQWFHGIGVFCLRLGFCYRMVTYLLSSRSIFDDLILMLDRGLLPWSACTAVVMMNQPQASSSKSFFATLTPGGIFWTSLQWSYHTLQLRWAGSLWECCTVVGALFPLPVSSFDARKLLLHQRFHHLKLHAKTRSSFQRLV